MKKSTILFSLICNVFMAFLFFNAYTNDKIPPDTCNIIRKNYVFISNGVGYPFSLQLKNFGFFIPWQEMKDIRYGFYEPVDSLFQGSYYTPCHGGDATRGMYFSGTQMYNDIEKVDTLYSSFNRVISKSFNLPGSEVDTFLLSREFEYSYLFSTTNQKSLLNNEYNNEIRITYAEEYKTTVKKINIIRVIFKDNRAYMYLEVIDTESSQDINVVRRDTVLLKEQDFVRLKSLMEDIQFDKLNQLRYNHCQDLYYEGYRAFEFVIEYQNDNIYDYALVCDVIDYHLPINDPRHGVIGFKNYIKNVLHYDYFVESKFKYLWKKVFN